MKRGGSLVLPPTQQVVTTTDLKPKVVPVIVEPKVAPVIVEPNVAPVIVENVQSDELQDLIATYPQHLSMIRGENLYVTPILVGEFDLKRMKIPKPQFRKVIRQLKLILCKTQTRLDASTDELYEIYQSILDNPGKHMDIIFIINLFVLISYNTTENFVNKSFYFYPPKKQTGGGPFELLVEFWGDRDYNLATGGGDTIFDFFSFLGTVFSILYMCDFFKLDSKVYPIVATIIVRCYGIRNMFLGADAVIRKLPGCATSKPFGNIFNYIGSGSLAAYMDKFKCELSSDFRKEFAVSSAKDYLEPITRFRYVNMIDIHRMNRDFQIYNFTGDVYTTPQEIHERVKSVLPAFTDEELINSFQFIDTESGKRATLTELGKRLFKTLDKGQRVDLIVRLRKLFYADNPPGSTRAIAVFSMTFSNATIDDIPVPETPTIVKYEIKKIKCPSCDELFCFDERDGYIHQITTESNVDAEIAKIKEEFVDTEVENYVADLELRFEEQVNLQMSEEEKELKKAEIKKIIEDRADTERKRLTEKFVNYVANGGDAYRKSIRDPIIVFNSCNAFPCRQMMESIDLAAAREDAVSPLPAEEAAARSARRAAAYKFTNEYIGDQLICSRCCLDNLKTVSDNEWPLYINTQYQRIEMTMYKVRQLIEDLSPVETLETILNRNRLTLVKFNQMNMSNRRRNQITQTIRRTHPNYTDEQVIAAVEKDIKVVQCPRCTHRRPGRFFRVFGKNDIEMLYLHCPNCMLDFNGCNGKKPYLLTKEQFALIVRPTEEGICDMVARGLFEKKRQAGRARVKMDYFKRYKYDAILREHNKKMSVVDKLFVKTCPRCCIVVCNDEGCSVMTCGKCGHIFCYVCSQSTEQVPHDPRHFLNDLTFPYGSFFGFQCVNVNYTMIDPDGNHGPYYNNEMSRGVLPNDNFRALTRMTWRKVNYLVEKYKRAGIEDEEDLRREFKRLVDSRIAWQKIDEISYNANLDVCYELGDASDPNVLAKAEADRYLEECDRNEIDPIMDAQHIPVEDDDVILEFIPDGAAAEFKLALIQGMDPGPEDTGAAAEPEDLDEEKEEEIRKMFDLKHREDAEHLEAQRIAGEAQAAKDIEFARGLEAIGDNYGPGYDPDRPYAEGAGGGWVPPVRIEKTIPQGFSRMGAEQQREEIQKYQRVQQDAAEKQNQERYDVLLQRIREHSATLNDPKTQALIDRSIAQVEEKKRNNEIMINLPTEELRQMIKQWSVTYFVEEWAQYQPGRIGLCIIKGRYVVVLVECKDGSLRRLDKVIMDSYPVTEYITKYIPFTQQNLSHLQQVIQDQFKVEIILENILEDQIYLGWIMKHYLPPRTGGKKTRNKPKHTKHIKKKNKNTKVKRKNTRKVS